MSIAENRIIISPLQCAPQNRLEQGHLRVKHWNFAASR
jgi:hypothetical protein